ncbi:amidase [Mycolicibacterium palauense]|uniref:amidase n=1 Tax=Mycolicibacterium palauense TaxID=2034511 RepID=UPI00159B86E4|nr:amidase family protein [Mycolicibacterium palauense]
MTPASRFSDVTPGEYAASSAVELGRRVATAELSPVHLVECALELAREAEPRINAYAGFMADRALRDAARAEREIRSGHLRSGLHGVPIAAKDNLNIAGEVIGKGSLTTSATPAATTSPIMARLLEAGAVVIGRTTTPEFGWKGTGISPRTGVTRNPWDTSRNTGGSSAGSGATVAAGAVPLATGTDAGGSVRIPAAFCGIVGFKPTLGAIPVWPATHNATLSHAGPMSRHVADARLAFDLTRGPDARDPQSFFSRRGPGLTGRARIAVVREPFGIAPCDAVAAVFEATVQLLDRAGVADLVELALPGPPPREMFEALWITGRGIGFGSTIRAHASIMDPGLVRLAELAQRYSMPDFLDVLARLREFSAGLFALFDRCDALLMPTMPITAFDAEAEVPEGGEADAALPWVTWTPYTYPFNLTGQPAITLPTHLGSTALPIGVQLVCAWSADDLLLDIAQWCESVLAATNPSRTAPAGPAGPSVRAPESAGGV